MNYKATTMELGVNFIAEEKSADRQPLGATVNFEAFGAAYGASGSKVIPAGTIVEIGAEGVVPATGAGRAYLTASTAVQGGRYSGSDTTGLYRAGIVYSDKLPQAVAGELDATLAGYLDNFELIESPKTTVTYL